MHQCVCYRPTVSDSYIIYNSITCQEFHSFHRLHRLYIDSSDIPKISEAICQFFKKTWLSYLCHSSESSTVCNLWTFQKEKNDRISFYRHNRAVRHILLTNLNLIKMIQKLVYYFGIKDRQRFGQKYTLNNDQPEAFNLERTTQNYSFHK